MRFTVIPEINGSIRTIKRYPEDVDIQVMRYSHSVFQTAIPIPFNPPIQRLTCIPLLLCHKYRYPMYMNQALDKTCLKSITQSE